MSNDLNQTTTAQIGGADLGKIEVELEKQAILLSASYGDGMSQDECAKFYGDASTPAQQMFAEDYVRTLVGGLSQRIAAEGVRPVATKLAQGIRYLADPDFSFAINLFDEEAAANNPTLLERTTGVAGLNFAVKQQVAQAFAESETLTDHRNVIFSSALSAKNRFSHAKIEENLGTSIPEIDPMSALLRARAASRKIDQESTSVSQKSVSTTGFRA